jgi:Holliday junction resolvase RusA-like endonuclease
MEVCKDCDMGNAKTGTLGRFCPIREVVSTSFSSGCASFVRRQASVGISTPPPNHLSGVERLLEAIIDPEKVHKGVKLADLTLLGFIRGGKNAICITRTGHRYPNKAWALWRDEMVSQIKGQYSGPVIADPVLAEIEYFAGDRKRRDIPAILDSIWHCLERAEVVADDCLIKSVYLKGEYDKANPRAIVRLYPMTNDYKRG